MRRRKNKSYHKLLRELREICPTIVPVRTRRCVLTDRMADTVLVCGDDGLPKYFLLRLDKALSWEATWVLLVHEWGHCMAWREGPLVCDHGPEWGVAHAAVWSDVVER